MWAGVSSQAISRANVGAVLYPLLQPELDEGLTASDLDTFWPYGDLRRVKCIDDDASDNAAKMQRFANVGLIVIPESDSKWAIASSVTLDNKCAIFSAGRAGAIRQTSWGVPVFEQRADDISIPGHLRLETTEVRAVFDLTALNASNNSATVKAEAAGDPKAAGSAIYGRTFNNMHIGHLDVDGFIAGALYASGNNCSIGQITVNNVDFGTFGQPGDGCQIGRVNAIAILKSQGVDPHAVYFPGSSGAIGTGLTIGEVTCASIATGSHIVSLKWQRDCSVGAIVGNGNTSNPLTLLECTGVIGRIKAVADVVATNDAAGAGILVQTNSEMTFGEIDYHPQQSNAVASNAGINITTGSVVRIGTMYLKMLNATPGYGVRSSATCYIDSGHVEYVTDPGASNQYPFFADGGFIDVQSCRIAGTSNVLRVLAAGTYRLNLSPRDVAAGLNATSIITNTGVYSTNFTEYGDTYQPFGVNDLTPSIRSGRLFKTANTAGTLVADFDNPSPGQVIRVLVDDAFTTFNFSTGNLVGNGGVNYAASLGDMIVAGYDGTKWYCEIIKA